MRPDPNYAIVIRNLNVWYGNKHVLKNINLAVKKNTILAIVGPSGSGKSTLLRVINRLIDLIPNARVEGEVYVLGTNVYNGHTDVSRLRRNVTMVFQTPNPFPHLTIYENVALGPTYNRIARNKEELDEIVKRSLMMAALWDEVKDRLHDKPTRLSGGQQQRLCIARALANHPKILLLDEPTSSIDPFSTQVIESTLKMLKTKITIVMVTHSFNQAMRVADYVLFMRDGMVEAFKPRSELVDSSEPLVKAYLRYST